MSIINPTTCQEARLLLLHASNYESASDMGRRNNIAPRKMRKWIQRAKDILNEDLKDSVKIRKPLQGVKILHYDLEIFMMKFKPQYGYELHQPERWMSYNEVEKDKSIMMFAYAWQHNKEVHLHSVLDNSERFCQDHYDDYELCLKLSELFNEADIVVAYNGDNFDWKMFQWRCKVNKLPAPKKPIMFDPFKIVKKEFKPTAKGLDAISKALGSRRKISMPNQVKCAEGDFDSIMRTGSYCKRDIPPMIDLFEELLFNGYIRSGLKVNSILGDNSLCISCGMNEFEDDGYDYTPRARYERKRCTTCHTSQRGAKI